MKSILLAHARQYPLLEPTDAVKLIYQNEFGGGHLIRDKEACLEFLHREYASVDQQEDLPLLEVIGNGMVRVQLAALDAHGFTVSALGAAFLRSAENHRGTIEVFRRKLSLLRQVTAAGQMPFSLEALDDYLAEYEAAGFPAVSHSERYRRAYRPAYRVVERSSLKNVIDK